MERTVTLSAPTQTRRDRGILSLTWPIFIELLLQMLVGNADQAMVGAFDPYGVGAIGNANQVTNLVLLVFSVISTASTILISQYLGAEEDRRRVNETYTVSLVVNGLFGLAIGGLLMVFCGPIFTLMQVPAEIFDRACLYLRIIGGGMVFQSVYLTFTAFFRSNQMMKESMIVAVVMNLLNIGGNAVLIGGAFGLPALGVAGAALSSDLSRLVGAVIIAVLFRRKFGPVLSLKLLRPFPTHQLGRLLRIGVPAGGESISYNLSQVCIQSTCNLLPLFVINTRVYANMFATVTYMFGSAISQAAQVLTARLMGAERIDDVDRLVKRTLAASLAISGLMSVVMLTFCRPLLGLFTQDPQVLELFRLIMIVEIPLELGRAVNMVMCRALQACGDIRFPITICIFSAWLTAALGGFLLAVPLGLGLVGLWIAMACDECLRALLFLWRWHSKAWCRKHLLSI
ncbi:MATE family efflux transporter [Pseudoflavonifractor phocaeensis]|uniref:MATE family efflux transporter n=1 Tax=Pseudoflavonifractor phocaeensis TaxID=1870988 RepID=UPI0019572671|nr:MATE family efflux transporter [Pseudoflavonifractor phocaeensis]MBM6926597.1 MATE family efflux transporter [Pseudoflavonifractor phocaeensis]